MSSVFAKRLARNRGPIPGDPDHRQPPNYGIAAQFDGEMIFLTLTFHAGSAYCCFEYGCHLEYYGCKRWDFLRKELVALGCVVPERLKLHATAIVENGALFFDWSRGDLSRRGWYEFAPQDAGRYEQDITEGEIGSPQSDARPGNPTPN